MQAFESIWIRFGMWVTQPRLRREEGMTTAELLANVALGIAFAAGIFALFKPLRQAVIEKISEVLKFNDAA